MFSPLRRDSRARKRNAFSAVNELGRVEYEFLPLSASNSVYDAMAAPYPRRGIARWLRDEVLASRIPTWLEILGLSLGFLWSLLQPFVQQIAQQWLEHGPQTIDWSKLLDSAGKSALWLWITDHPLLAILCAIVLASTVWATILLGNLARADQKVERDVLLTYRAGLDLAHLFRTYLENLQASTGRLPPLLGALSVTAKPPDENVETILAPLQMRKIDLQSLDSGTLDQPTDSDQESVGTWNSGDSRESLHALPMANDLGQIFQHSLTGAVVILGQPGAGKTTLLWYQAWIQAQYLLDGACYPEVRIPVYADLASEDAISRDLPTFIKFQVESACARAGSSPEAIQHLTKSIIQRALVLIDSLDEVTSTTRDSALRHIQDFLAERRPPPTVVERPVDRWDTALAIGSRIAGYIPDVLPNCETWELLPLTNVDAQRAIVVNSLRVWTQATGSSASLLPDALLAQLASSSVAAWVRSPLLLTLTTIVWADCGGSELVSTRVMLYRRAVLALMTLKTRNWGDSQRQRLLDMAAETAFILFFHGKRGFYVADTSSSDTPYFDRDIWPFLPDWLPSSYGPTNLAPADALSTASGLFFRIEKAEYNILHLSILEYLAALALTRRLHQQFPEPVAADTFRGFLREKHLYEDYLTPPNEAESLAGALGLLWAKRTTARWTEAQRLVSGILAQPIAQGYAESNASTYSRTDLVISWIRALLDQPHDIGALGLGLGMQCLSEADYELDTALTDDVVKRVLQLVNRRVVQRVLQEVIKTEALIPKAAGQSRVSFNSSVSTRLITTLANSALAWDVRASAATVLGELAHQMNEAVVQELLDVLAEDTLDPRLRAAAGRSLGELGSQMSDPVIQTLLGIVTNPTLELELRKEALRALGKLGSAMPASMLQILFRELQHPVLDVWMDLIERGGLGGDLSDPVIQTLLGIVTDSTMNELARGTAVIALGKLGPQMDGTVTQTLLGIVNDAAPDSWLRVAATEALGKLGPQMSEPIVQTMVRILDDSSLATDLRTVAAYALRELGPQMSEPIVQTLLALVTNSTADPDVRSAAVGALSSNLSESVVPILLGMVANATSDRSIRAAAARALGELGPHMSEPVVQALLGALHDLDIGSAAAVSLGRLGPQMSKPVVQALVRALTDPIPDERNRATLKAALDLLKTGDLEVQAHVLQEELNSATLDSRLKVAEAAARALGELGPQMSEPVVQVLLDVSIDATLDLGIRSAAVKSLGELGPQMSESVAQALLGILADMTLDHSAYLMTITTAISDSFQLDEVEAQRFRETLEYLAQGNGLETFTARALLREGKGFTPERLGYLAKLISELHNANYSSPNELEFLVAELLALDPDAPNLSGQFSVIK